MNAYANVSLIENKLDELLSENHLVHTFRTSSYPVVLTISQDASPEAQVTLFESTDSGEFDGFFDGEGGEPSDES